MKRCKDCQSAFEIEEATAQWFLDRRLHLPLRCKQCRAAKKEHHENPQPAQPAKAIQYHQGCQVSEAKTWYPQVQAASLLFPSDDSKDPADNPTHCRSNSSPEEVTFQKSDHGSISGHWLPLLNTRAVGGSKEKRSETRVPSEPIQDDIGPTPAEENTTLDFHESSDNSNEFRAASEPKGRFGTARQPTMSLNPCHPRHQRHQHIGHQEQWPYTTVPTKNANSLKTHRCTLHQTPSLLWSRPATQAQTNTILHSFTIEQILSPLPSLQATLNQIRLDPPFLSVINFKSMTNI